MGVSSAYGVLWFIYVLALTGIAAKVVTELRIPHWLTFVGAAALSMAQFDTPSYAFDQFARYFVFFYAGYALAPLIFKLVARAIEAPIVATIALLAWASLNGALVFTPGFVAEPGHFTWISREPLLKFALALSDQ